MDLERLIKAAWEIDRLGELQTKKTREVQLLAKEAKRTGKNLTHKLRLLGPTVVNFEDAISELRIALKVTTKT